MQPGLAPHEWVACGCRTHLSSNATDDLKIFAPSAQIFLSFCNELAQVTSCRQRPELIKSSIDLCSSFELVWHLDQWGKTWI